MILDEFVKIKITKFNCCKINKKLNTKYSIGETINFPIEKLSKSNYTIQFRVKCDICGDEKETNMRLYQLSYKNGNIYSCFDCKTIKTKKTYLEKYGDENYRNMEKVKKTKLEKYGDMNYNNRDKAKETIINLYGVDNTSKLKEFQDKWKQTNIEKYGCENVFGNEEIKEKIKETYVSKYGCEYPSQCDDIMKKILISSNRERKYDIKSYENYKMKVYNETYKKKKELFEKWEGYDYYDNEYIKDNLNYVYTDKLYPTIDHKFSILYCFLNNISIEDCCDINNLCITTRSNNSSKSRKIESDFFPKNS